MSSFIGFYGKNDSLKTSIKNLVPNFAFTLDNTPLFLCANGNPLNTHFHNNSDSNFGWVSCGIGISSEEKPKVLRQNDWINVFDNKLDLHNSLNGHYAIIKWNQKEVKLYTDQLGMRNIFIHRNKDHVLFSTRLDWMLKLVGKTSINWAQFGSNWLAINPFSSSSFVNGIERLAQGGYACISDSKFTVRNNRWIPQSIHSSIEIVEDSLRSFSSTAINTFSKTSLGLSGGLDSRVLLALLASQKKSAFDLYTFEIEKHPDIKYAVQSNKPYGFKHEIIPLQMPTNQQVISELPEITSRTMLASSLFHIEPLNGYKRLGLQNSITIDGGFGEIARRRYLRGIEISAKQTVLEKSISGLLSYLSINKADIFAEEVIQEMKKGLHQELKTETMAMPDANDIGIGNWLDIFSIRSRAQNLSGLKQEIVDEKVFHIMPFLQADFLNKLLSIPEKERVNAELYRRIIQKAAPELSNIPLVKGDDVYPYWMKDIPSMAWVRLKRNLGLGYKSTQNIKLILSLEEYIRDTFTSTNVVQSSFYDKRKIDIMITNFFEKENHSLATQLGWLVSFEAFRTQVY